MALLLSWGVAKACRLRCPGIDASSTATVHSHDAECTIGAPDIAKAALKFPALPLAGGTDRKVQILNLDLKLKLV